MTPRLIVGLAIAAMVSVGVATAAYLANHRTLSTAGAGERLLPGLVEKTNEVAEITIASREGSTTVEARDGRWQVRGSGYPVEREKVAGLLVGLARMARLEPKTDNPAKYARLDVDAPDKAEAKGRLLTLKDAKGAHIAEVILGKPATGQGAGGREQYVRLPSEDASWLVQGNIEAAPGLASFVDTKLLSLDSEEITAARFRHVDGTSLEVKRTGTGEDGAPRFEVTGLPAASKLKSEPEARYAATDLASVEFTDARPLKAGTKPVAEAEVEAAKGLKVGFKLVEEGGKAWLSIQVLVPGEDKAAADAIASKAKGWEFAVSDRKAKQFKKKLADLLAP